MADIKESLGWRRELSTFQWRCVEVCFRVDHENWHAILDRELLVDGNYLYGVSSDTLEGAATELLCRLKEGPIRINDGEEYVVWDAKHGLWKTVRTEREAYAFVQTKSAVTKSMT